MRPLARYFEQSSAWSPHTFTRCHSTRSCFCPALSFQTSLVATLRLHTGRLLGVYFSSGSAPRFPTRMTLLTLPMVNRPPNQCSCFCHLPAGLSIPGCPPACGGDSSVIGEAPA